MCGTPKYQGPGSAGKNTSGIKAVEPGSTYMLLVSSHRCKLSLADGGSSEKPVDLEAVIGDEGECDALAAPNGRKVCPAKLPSCKVIADARETGKNKADTIRYNNSKMHAWIKAVAPTDQHPGQLSLRSHDDQ